jgi:hypothetical protein
MVRFEREQSAVHKGGGGFRARCLASPERYALRSGPYPTGVDLEFFAGASRYQSMPTVRRTLSHTGSMDWAANVDGAKASSWRRWGRVFAPNGPMPG